MRRAQGRAMRILAALAVACSASAIPITGTGATHAPILSGAYYNLYSQSLGSTGAWDPHVEAFDRWVGKKQAVHNLFAGWQSSGDIGPLFGTALPAVWANGSVPAISWYPGDNALQIALGLHDAYLLDWGRRMRTFLAGPDRTYGNADDRRAYIRLAPEANGNWNTFSPAYQGAGQPPNCNGDRLRERSRDYRLMWRHIHTLFAGGLGMDSTRLAWLYVVAQDDACPQPITEMMYPGDDYVDWVGLDGYSRNPDGEFQTPADVFDAMVQRLRTLAPAKPLTIAEVGAAVQPGFTVAEKNAWIDEFYGTYAPSIGARMVLWWNSMPPGNPDWRVFGSADGDSVYVDSVSGKSYNVFSSYADAMTATHYIGGNLNNPRRLSDQQFLGL